MVASELSGFANKVKNYFVLENHDLAHIYINNNKLVVDTTSIYNKKSLANIKFDLTPEPYPHWTLKEIMEQSESILRAINNGGRILNDECVRLGGLSSHIEKLKDIDNIIILGCGTSLHAGLIGAEYFKELSDFNTVQVFDGAEFEIKDIPKKDNTGLIYLSQSGETKDLHRCIEIGKENNLIQIGIINVVDSLIAREVDCGCYINAGREVGVASTKCFTNQVIILSLIAVWFAQIKNINKNKRIRFINDLRKLSNDFKNTLDLCETKKNILQKFINVESLFLLGKGQSRFIAREGALKIKEICYLHAEGYGGSALKHGPFALLDEKHPVILLTPYNKYYSKMMNAKEEILSRKAPVLIISNKHSGYLNEIILPTNNTFQDLLGIIPLQLAAYYCSVAKNINCDQPKNLAKCVNVE
jgi:glucosamine--fructose-6-phosphate aminotransferase (isomerizing)